MYLFLKTHASGALQKGLPLDAPEQPWICFLAAQLCDKDGNELASINTGIRSDGRGISEAATALHGISTRRSACTGVKEKAVLSVLCGRDSLVSQARYVIGHGLQRDIITGVILRNNWDASVWTRQGVEIQCTQLAAAPFCKIKSEDDSGGYRMPSLDEACQFLLFGEESLPGLRRSAWDDLRRCKSLFFWLRERGAFDLAEAA